MKPVKLYYAKLPNMGDLLNEYIVPMVTGREIEHCESVSKFDVMGIGSCGGAIWGNKYSGIKNNIKDSAKKLICGPVSSPYAVWGTGLLQNFSGRKLELVRKNVNFIAVRGALTQKVIEESLGRKINPVLCDGGILTADLLGKIPDKEFEVGIIPHYKEEHIFQNNGIYEGFKKKFPSIKIIDLREDPIKVIKDIAKCSIIISSSLHGCVCADSFNIPNMRIQVSSIPGSGYKFDDYYSGFGITNPAFFINDGNNIPSYNDVIDQYKIRSEDVEEKKRGMRDCLLKFVEEQIS
ncbi:polysaccharide pyruvyl transferase family protein [Neobacillus niacini]|uniref:polysaccharide pyruvyl transferase family protein n=1 Tax=Neobacillus niacini TaxID=86668 RepID=UPI002FFFC74F